MQETVNSGGAVSSSASNIERGGAYWFFQHIKDALLGFMKRHALLSVISILTAFLATIYFRAFFHPYYMVGRTHLFLVILGGCVLMLGAFLWLWARQGGWRAKILACMLFVSVVGAFMEGGLEAHRYMAFYYRYHTLKVVELDRLPLTNYERIQPLNSIHSRAYESMSESETPTIPDFVRVGNGYRWTIGVEPSYDLARLTNGVSTVLSISGTSPAPDISAAENRKMVSFQMGEHLLWGRNSDVCATRSFSFEKYLNYEPSGMVYMPDASGKWIGVISLIRWEGIFFPQPVFGGVIIVRQEPYTLTHLVRQALVGCGEWIGAGDIQKYPFLRGQNLISHTVSRYAADSFRFQEGFLAPFPGYHNGDIRIPDLPADVNDQPFTAYFEGIPGKEGALYQYFALEPFSPDKQGLNTSLFIPADGTDTIYVYRHNAKGEAPIGVSAVASKVMESRKNYDWNKNRPVEHRPYIRVMHGRERLFWLTTVVTKKDETSGGRRFIAGNTPEIVLTDAATSSPVWVDSLRPDTWVSQLEKDLSHIWANQ
jgi:hypothetical protein